MSGKHTFLYEPDVAPHPDEITVLVETKAELLEKVISAMEAYLLACGYVFPENCHLGFEEDEGVSLSEHARFNEADPATHPDNGA